MRSENEIRQFIRGLKINRKLALGEGKKGKAKRLKDQINLLRWVKEGGE